jgi:hypothetical protein
MSFKTTLGKVSPNFSEHGIQNRDGEPERYVQDQIWYNTTTGKLNYYNATVATLFKSYIEGAKPADIVYPTLVGSNLTFDFSIGQVYKQELSGTVNVSFANVQDGMSRYAIILASRFASATVTWPAGTKVAEGDSYAMAQGSGIIVQMTNIGGVNYVKTVFKAAGANQWPIGIQGDLVINNGETVNIPAGSIRDYNNVTINAGGTLAITGNSMAITQIGVRFNLVVNGIIRNEGYYGLDSSYSVVTPSGETIAYSITQSASGRGGNGNAPGAAAGGDGVGGYGGGGGGAGGPGRGGYGGTGGSNNSPGYNSPAGGSRYGLGNYTLGNGLDGQAVFGGHGGGSGGGGSNYGGAGGGGGYKGTHGRGLYLYVTGTISGTGQISCAGGNGYNGGLGGPYANGHGAGGGGGGGAGGSGGTLWVRKPAASPFTVPVTVAGGTGGVGGSSSSQSGTNGNAGANGLVNVANNG